MMLALLAALLLLLLVVELKFFDLPAAREEKYRCCPETSDFEGRERP